MSRFILKRYNKHNALLFKYYQYSKVTLENTEIREDLVSEDRVSESEF